MRFKLFENFNDNETWTKSDVEKFIDMLCEEEDFRLVEVDRFVYTVDGYSFYLLFDFEKLTYFYDRYEKRIDIDWGLFCEEFTAFFMPKVTNIVRKLSYEMFQDPLVDIKQLNFSTSSKTNAGTLFMCNIKCK